MYEKLDKELKVKAQLKFKKSNIYYNTRQNFIRINICFITLLLYSAYLMLFSNRLFIDKFLISVSLISSIIIFIYSKIIKIKLINKFLSNENTN